MHLLIHIPKTAGTSLRDRLQACYRQRIAFDYGPRNELTHPVLADSNRSLRHKRTLLDEQGIELIYGHVKYLEWRAAFAPNEVSAVLRHPVDRCISHYQHMLSYGDEDDSELAAGVRAERIGLAEFACHPDIANFQAQVLCIGADTLDDLKQFRCLYLSESMATYFGVSKWLNQGQRNFPVRPADIAAIVAANSVDMLLYELVRQAWREGYWRWHPLLKTRAPRFWARR